MKKNKVESIDSLRIESNVLQYKRLPNDSYRPIIQAIEVTNVTPLLQFSDVGKYIRVNISEDANIVIPNSEYFPIGGIITFEQTGLGRLTIVSDTDITIRGKAISIEQYSILQILKVGSSEWIVIGGTDV